MKIALGTIEVDDYVRRAVGHHYGEDRPASRQRCRDFVRSNGELALDSICLDYDNELERRASHWDHRHPEAN